MLLQPKHKYIQRVQRSFRVTQATMDLNSCNDEAQTNDCNQSVQIWTKRGAEKFLIGILSAAQPQQTLNVVFSTHDGEVSIFVKGQYNVHLWCTFTIQKRLRITNVNNDLVPPIDRDSNHRSIETVDVIDLTENCIR